MFCDGFGHAWRGSNLNILYVPIGMAIGLVVTAPVGPVNLLCLNRGLAYGALSAFAVGLGAVFGDTVFAALAAFGVATFTDILKASRDPIRFFGGLVMIGFAVVIWCRRPHIDLTMHQPSPVWREAIATFVMTVTNPGTLMAFTAIFAGTGFKKLGLSTAEHAANSTALVFGVLLGCTLWWALLAGLAKTMQARISDAFLGKINKVSAVLLALFGLAAMVAGLVE